jgi:hypothetical protein
MPGPSLMVAPFVRTMSIVFLVVISFCSTIRAEPRLVAEAIALSDVQPPHMPTGATYQFFDAPSMNNAGQVAFYCRMLGGGLTPNNDCAIFAGDAGNLRLVFHENAELAALGPGGKFGIAAYQSSWNQSPVINANGDTAFVTDIFWPIMGFAGRAVIAEANAAATPVARVGNPVPGTPAATIEQFTPTSVFVPMPTINDNGAIAYFAELTGPQITSFNDGGLFRSAGGNIEKYVRDMDTFGSHAIFEMFAIDTAVQNASGFTAFFCEATGPTNHYGVYGGTTSGLVRFAKTGDPVRIVARRGDQAPGLAPGYVFAEFASENQLSNFNVSGIAGTVAMNAADQIAFAASVFAPDGSPGGGGIWMAQPDGTLQLVVASGMILDVNSDPEVEDLRTVSSISMIHGSGGGDGRRRSLADDGRIACQIFFTNNTRGVFRLSLTESVACDCPGDMTGDGLLDGQDVQSFTRCLSNAAAPDCGCADVNEDSTTTFADVAVFVQFLVDGISCE